MGLRLRSAGAVKAVTADQPAGRRPSRTATTRSIEAEGPRESLPETCGARKPHAGALDPFDRLPRVLQGNSIEWRLEIGALDRDRASPFHRLEKIAWRCFGAR